MMRTFFEDSVFFGVLVSIAAYSAGSWLKRKFRQPLFHPLLIGVALVIALLAFTGIGYDKYYAGARYLSYLLTPATVALAIPLYEQVALLRRYGRAVLAGIFAGVLTSLVSILVLAAAFRLDHAQYVTLLPKSITTAIGMGVSEELGGYVSLTVAVIVVTGILGNMFAEQLCRLFRITDPVAVGVALGTSAHAVGTVKAMELGEVQGAMSSLSIAVAGVLTVAGASVFAALR